MSNITWHDHIVSRVDREKIAGHAGCVAWFTGLSGSGKSTIANAVDYLLTENGVRSFLLDGDNIRHGLNCGPGMLEERHGRAFAERFGLGFSAQDREENIRRIGSVAQLFCSAGIVTLTAFVSPYRRDRDHVRRQVTEHGRKDDFIEIFVDAPLELCESRDPKGLYRKARAGELSNFTGIDDPYEPPESPELVLKSADETPEELAKRVVCHLENIGKIPAKCT
jgi:adenylylsulfate kinase